MSPCDGRIRARPGARLRPAERDQPQPLRKTSSAGMHLMRADIFIVLRLVFCTQPRPNLRFPFAPFRG